jgi:hypothetical protein
MKITKQIIEYKKQMALVANNEYKPGIHIKPFYTITSNRIIQKDYNFKPIYKRTFVDPFAIQKRYAMG